MRASAAAFSYSKHQFGWWSPQVVKYWHCSVTPPGTVFKQTLNQSALILDARTAAPPNIIERATKSRERSGGSYTTVTQDARTSNMWTLTFLTRAWTMYQLASNICQYWAVADISVSTSGLPLCANIKTVFKAWTSDFNDVVCCLLFID